MGIQKGKFIFTVGVYSKLHPKGKREWEGEKRGEITCLGETASHCRNQGFISPGFSPNFYCEHLHLRWLSWLPFVAAGRNRLSQAHLIWPLRDAMRQSGGERTYSQLVSGWDGEICTVDAYCGQKTLTPVISVAHKCMFLKQIFREAYGFVLREKSYLWVFSGFFHFSVRVRRPQEWIFAG